MNVFYIEVDKFKKKYDKSYLLAYTDRELKTEKRFYEYTLGRYLIKNAAEKYFNISDTQITTTKEGKPIFKNSDLNFSISHAGNIVIACFDKRPCGIDIEYNKPRNLNRLSKYFKQQFDTNEDC